MNDVIIIIFVVVVFVIITIFVVIIFLAHSLQINCFINWTQVLQGMCYLEKRGFGHRDLSAANVLVGDRNITKIANFGLLIYYAGRKCFREYDNGLQLKIF